MSKNQAFKDEVRKTCREIKNYQDAHDYENILDRFDFIRRANAIKDIVDSQRLPFTTDVAEADILANEKISTLVFPPIEVANLTGTSIKGDPPVSRLLRTKSPKQKGGNNDTSSTMKSNSPTKSKSDIKLSAAMSIPEISKANETSNQTTMSIKDHKTRPTSANTKKKKEIIVTKPKIKQMVMEDNPEDKKVDAMLQYVVDLMAKARTDFDPSKLFFECAEIFETLKFFDRAVFAYQKATVMSKSDIIVDHVLLPNDEKYQRKIKYMSPTVLPTFLAQRGKKRDELIYEESERQRLRKRRSHCELVRLFALVIPVQDFWKAHATMIQAFETCKDHEEHVEMLKQFHQLLKDYTALMKGKPELQTNDQIVRATAGPLSEAHVEILLELQELEPENGEYQEWLGKRYTEKCDFDESLAHYKNARDIRKLRPNMQDTLTLWRKPLPKPKDIRVLFGQATLSDTLVKRNAFSVNKLLGDLHFIDDEETEQQRIELDGALKKNPYHYFTTDGDFDDHAQENLSMSISRKEYNACYRYRNIAYYEALKKKQTLPSFVQTGSNCRGEFGTMMISGGDGNNRRTLLLGGNTVGTNMMSMNMSMNHTGSMSSEGSTTSTVGTFHGTLSGGNSMVLGATTGTGMLSEEEINARDFAWFRGKHHDGNTILFIPPPQGWAAAQPLSSSQGDSDNIEEDK